MTDDLSRPALITGGSSGIGLALAHGLAAEGRPLVLVARDAAKLALAAEQLREPHPSARILTIAADVGDAAAVAAAVQSAVEAFGPLGYVIANAGIARPGLFLEQPLQDHLEQMRTNYFGALYLAHAARQAFAPGARLVFVSSGAALFGVYGYSAYGPSKFAVRGLAEVLRLELAGIGVSVTLAYPPDTDTPQLAAETLTKPEATKRITAGGGVHSAEAVAARILAKAKKGDFLVTHGLGSELLMRAQDLIGPLVRRSQLKAVAATEREDVRGTD